MPGLADHARIPARLQMCRSSIRRRALLEQAVSLDPTNAAVHAARGNLLLRRGKTEAAQRSYELAVRFDIYDAPSRIALGELMYMAGDERAAERWFSEALALTRVYSPRALPDSRSALVLCVGGPWPRNIPLDFVVDPAQWALHRWYLPDAALDRGVVELPDCDVVIDAIGASRDADRALDAAERFIADRKPVVNDPRRVRGTARDKLATTLAGVAGCAVAPVQRLAEDGLLAIRDGFPLLVRPTDAHGGRRGWSALTTMPPP